MLRLLMVLLLLELVLVLMLFCTCCDESILLRENAYHAGRNFMVDDGFIIFADNVDSEFLENVQV